MGSIKKTWSGHISFGLVNVPVALYTATRDNDVRFNLLHKGCNTKIVQKRFCPTCNVDVEYADIVKGKEVEEGKFVAIEKEEIERLNGNNNKKIEIMKFVNPNEVANIYNEKSYYVAPDKNGEKAFILLKNAMEQTDKVAIGTFVMRNKKHLVALKCYEDIILLTQLHYADEVKDTKALEYKLDMPSKEEIKMAMTLIEKRIGKFDIQDYKDETAEALVNLIAEKSEEQPKAKGKKGKAVSAGAGASNLMSLMTASMGNEKKEKKVSVRKGK